MRHYCHYRPDLASLTSTDKSKPLCSSGLDADTAVIHPHYLGDGEAHPLYIRREFGGLHRYRNIRIANLIPMLAHQTHDLREQTLGINAGITGIRIREMLAYVSERQCAQQRIAQGMYRHIPVGMRHKSPRALYPDSSEPHRQTVRQSMDVIALSYPYIHILLYNTPECRGNNQKSRPGLPDSLKNTQ